MKSFQASGWTFLNYTYNIDDKLKIVRKKLSPYTSSSSQKLTFVAKLHKRLLTWTAEGLWSKIGQHGFGASSLVYYRFLTDITDFVRIKQHVQIPCEVYVVLCVYYGDFQRCVYVRMDSTWGCQQPLVKYLHVKLNFTDDVESDT